MKRKMLIGLSVVAIALLLCWGVAFAICSYRNSPGSMQEVYEDRWNIQLPAGMRELYIRKPPSSMDMGGIHITVYQIDPSTENDFLSSFSDQKDSAVEAEIAELLSYESPDTEPIDPAWYPDFNEDYRWCKLEKDMDVIYFIITADGTQLTLIEFLK
mgnify:FL=1